MSPVSNSHNSLHTGKRICDDTQYPTAITSGHLKLRYCVTPAPPGQDFLNRYNPTSGIETPLPDVFPQ